MWQVGTIRIGRIGGIAIDVHITFALVIVWGIWLGSLQYDSLLGIGYRILLILLVYLCVLLHEFGHVIQAQAVGMRVRRIILLPIGGLVEYASTLTHASHELFIALAGPLVNLGLAGILGIAAFLVHPFTSGTWVDESRFVLLGPPTLAAALFDLVAANALLFVFNMLPAFPMDGGRVLRAGMALLLDYEIATRIAAWLGCLMAIGMGIFGLIGWPPFRILPHPLLAAITILTAITIYYGAHYEEFYVRRQRALVRVEVGEIARRVAETLAPWDAITGNLIARLFRHEKAIPVLVEERVVGLLTYQDIRHLHDRSSPVTVAHVMRSHFPSVQPGDTLWVALQEMNAFQLSTLPVVVNGVFQGVVSLDDIDHAWRFAPSRRRRGKATLASGDELLQ